MKSEDWTNRWGLNMVALIFLLPVLLFPLLMIQIIKRAPFIVSPIKLVGWLGLPVFILMIILYVTSFILVLWKGRLWLAVLIVFLSLCLLPVLYPILPISGEARQLSIHQFTPRIEVYCNDVYLGETPLKISEKKFHEKVKPWDTPPRQKMVIGGEFIQNTRAHHNGLANTELRWYYTPYHYFDQHRAFDQPGFSSYDDAVTCGYWWRFERDDCTGFAMIQYMVSGSHGSGQHLEIWSDPYLQYPSVQPYLRHLLHDLKRSNYQPSVEWRTHVANSSGLLFQHLYEIGRRDSRVMQALEMTIQMEFGVHEGMLANEWEAVLDEAMSRVKQRRIFLTPSPESMVMDLILHHNMKLIETRFLELLSRAIQPQQIFVFGLNRSWDYREPAGFLLLEYAVLKSCPPALFKRLVHESRRGERFLSMVSSYQNEEAERIVRQYFDDIHRRHPFTSTGIQSQSQRMALSFAKHLRNPVVEPELRRFVLKHAQVGLLHAEHKISDFVHARLNHQLTEAEADSLTVWVAETIPLRDDEKLRLLSRIDSEIAYRYVREMVLRQPSYQNVVVRSLIHHPNPSLDLFLIEAYQAESANVNFGGFVPITSSQQYLGNPRNLKILLRGMLLCDTPRMYTFLERMWNANNGNKISLLEAIKQDAPKHYPHLYRWITPISQIENADTRLAAIPVLDQIDTPESSEILRDWAVGSAEAVKREAGLALENYRERSRLARGLLAGNVRPDDLLTGQTAYVWNGENYVPEAAASGSR